MFKQQNKRIILLLNSLLFAILQCCFVHHVFLQRFEHSINNCVFMSGTAVKVSESGWTNAVWYRSTLRRSFGALARCQIMTT